MDATADASDMQNCISNQRNMTQRLKRLQLPHAVRCSCDTSLISAALSFLAHNYKQSQNANQGIFQVGVVIHDYGHLPHIG